MLVDPARPPLDLARRWSVEEVLALPHDGRRYELFDGTLHVSPAPAPRHQRVAFHLTTILGRLLDAPGLARIYPAPCDVRLAGARVFEPDLVALRPERLHLVGPRYIDGAPDLVIEILSPSTRHLDRGEKLEAYGAAGVAEYWLVDLDAASFEVRAGAGTLPVVATFAAAELVRCVTFAAVVFAAADAFAP